MMLTIHGLPLAIKYVDVKVLIKEKCNISDYILDNLVSDGNGTKKVRIGLADDREGAHFIKCLDGYPMAGNVLQVVPYGKTPQSNPPQNYDQQGYQPRNDFPNQTGSYGNHAMDPAAGRPDPWGPHNNANQWGHSQPGPNQPVGHPGQQNNYNYQQPQSANASYGQQQGASGPRGDMRSFDQRDQFPSRMPQEQGQGYGFPPKNVPDPMPQRPSPRAHVLRSVELVPEPLRAAPRPPMPYTQQKPITIMKDNFQGPQFSEHQPYAGGSGHAPPQDVARGHMQGPSHQMQGQGPHGSWNQSIQQQKAPFAKPSPTADRRYTEAEKRPMSKPMGDIPRGPNDPYNKDFDKPGPRFSPRRDIPMQSPGQRMPSPGRRMGSPGRRMPSPGRRMPSPGRRMSSPGRRMPSPGRRMPSPGRRMPSPGRRMTSPGRRMPSPGRRMASPGRRMPSPGRRMISPGRRMPSPGRRMPSPGRRMPSPGRRMPSPGRRMPSPGRRMPSPGRRMPSPGRRMPSPGRRMPSPGRRVPSPGRRMPSPGRGMPSPGKRISPGRRMSPGDRRMGRPASPAHKRHDDQDRYSPSRRHLDKADKYGGPDSRLKDVRPAYDPPTQAPNQAMYSGGYRPENAYGMRQERPWQQDRDKPSLMKKDEPKFEPRIVEPRGRSPRKSRSPPRFKKHSPSPRSPRRSWALEKRSPEVPPPPVWPGLRPFPDDDKSKRQPVWEPRRIDDDRFDDTRRDVNRPLPQDRSRFKDDRFPLKESRFEPREPKFEPREPKFEPREPKFEPREPKFEPREPKFEPREPKFEPREPKFEPREEFRRMDDGPKRFDREFRPADDIRHQDHDNRREDLPRREDERKFVKVPESFNKELDDVYKRAVEFSKRAEELRRRDGKRDEMDRRENEKNRDDRRDDYKRQDWKEDKRNINLSPTHKAKRDKAIEELAKKILNKHGSHLEGDIKSRVTEELKLSVGKVLQQIFGFQEVSFIEMVIKFNSRVDGAEELKMYNDVVSSFPSHFRIAKRSANEPVMSDIAAKSARRDEPHMSQAEAQPKAVETPQVPEWANYHAMAMQMANPMLMTQVDPNLMQQMQMMMQQPLMVPAPGYEQFVPPPLLKEPTPEKPTPAFQEPPPKSVARDDENNLYLCKDDFEPYSENQAEYLKKFLVSQIIAASQDGSGWSPDLTVKGLQSMFRYEIESRDEATRNWLLNMDFSEFSLFNVLVYTKEELWYERAAVWLPGHSRCRHIEPLNKLKLQNAKLDGVNIGKWKLVKKIITIKGTRIYVDMPPSSARALEKHKMLLSYELQKVSVFLKAIAVDKDVFDAGMREISIKDQAEIIAAVQSSPMPSLAADGNVIKICLKGNKSLSLPQARKIKEMIIYHIFKYHQEYGTAAGRTDFLKFGFCLPGYFGIVPENGESKRWLMSLNIGKLNKHAVVILGADESSTKYIKMTVTVPSKLPEQNQSLVLLERIKHSNQGVKGLNFNLWKAHKVYTVRSRTMFDIDIDLESVETIMKNKFMLDYVDHKQNQHSVSVRYEKSDARLLELIKKYKNELSDSYDVANMEIASSDDENDIIYMGETK